MAMDTATRHYVSHGDLESLLASLEALPGDARAGFFGPDSISWRINRESAVFLGAGRAALLQLAHPWVTASLYHHSNLLDDAISRFHSTFRVIYTMLFGTRAQALAASRQLYRRHTGITGELPHSIGDHTCGDHYEANEVAALRWVYATLVDSAVLAYEFVLPALTPAEREQYYSESKHMAALFGLPPQSLPTSWSEFAAYCREMFDSPLLGVDDNARALGHSVMSGVGTWMRPPRWYGLLTSLWMPPRFRSAFDLPPVEDGAIHRLRRILMVLYPPIPRAVRFVGPYHEAHNRLRGRAPGLLTRQSNLFWMGQAEMLFPKLSD